MMWMLSASSRFRWVSVFVIKNPPTDCFEPLNFKAFKDGAGVAQAQAPKKTNFSFLRG
jgi:hypothetical protein